MFITIDLNSDVPIYQQLRDQLILGIALGKLKPGESLPSVRQLGSDLGINLHTVNKVYALLKQEGFLTIHRQKGVVVNEKSEYKADDSYKLRLAELMSTYLVEAYSRGLSLDEVIELVSQKFEEIKRG